MRVHLGVWLNVQYSSNVEFLEEINIDYVCHDEIPYTTIECDDAYGICKKLGKFKATKRTTGVSTTDVIGKILREK